MIRKRIHFSYTWSLSKYCANYFQNVFLQLSEHNRKCKLSKAGVFHSSICMPCTWIIFWQINCEIFLWFFKIFITIGADGTTNPCRYFVPPIYSYNVMTRICGSIRPHCYENFENTKILLIKYWQKMKNRQNCTFSKNQKMA